MVFFSLSIIIKSIISILFNSSNVEISFTFITFLFLAKYEIFSLKSALTLPALANSSNSLVSEYLAENEIAKFKSSPVFFLTDFSF